LKAIYAVLGAPQSSPEQWTSRAPTHNALWIESWWRDVHAP